jgi:hypothetical protein
MRDQLIEARALVDAKAECDYHFLLVSEAIKATIADSARGPMALGGLENLRRAVREMVDIAWRNIYRDAANPRGLSSTSVVYPPPRMPPDTCGLARKSF